jgi:hypothetical protein
MMRDAGGTALTIKLKPPICKAHVPLAPQYTESCPRRRVTDPANRDTTTKACFYRFCHGEQTDGQGGVGFDIAS